MAIEQAVTPPPRKENRSSFSTPGQSAFFKDPQRWVLFVSGIMLTGASVPVVVRSDMGVSVLASVPYMLSLSVPAVSLGTFNYVVQGLLMLLLVPILRRIKVQWLLSFGVSVLFGLTIDVFTFAFSFLPEGGFSLRLVYFFIGFFLLTLGVPLTIKSGFPALPFDVFVKEVAAYKRKTFRQVKTRFDLIFLSISIGLMFLVVRRLTGIGPGTIFATFVNGTAMQLWLRWFDKVLPERFSAK